MSNDRFYIDGDLEKTFWFDLADNFSIVYTKDSEIDSLNHLKFVFNEMKDELNFKRNIFRK